MHPALRRVDPAGWHLNDLVTGLLGAVQHLDIETETARLEHGKHALGHLGGERLKPHCVSCTPPSTKIRTKRLKIFPIVSRYQG